jgi:hypothetical protein
MKEAVEYRVNIVVSRHTTGKMVMVAAAAVLVVVAVVVVIVVEVFL